MSLPETSANTSPTILSIARQGKQFCAVSLAAAYRGVRNITGLVRDYRERARVQRQTDRLWAQWYRAAMRGDWDAERAARHALDAHREAEGVQ